MSNSTNRPPLGLRWRASFWYATFVVFLGIAVDLLAYSVIIPVLPFYLIQLGYDNISGRLGWLVFAYSGGLVAATIPAAMLSERYQARWAPLVFGLLVLIGSQIMFMEVTNFGLMCFARVLQGVASSAVWVVGLALITDQTPEAIIGRQLGIAMTGLTLGLLVGPASAGAIYRRFGIRGPFVFSISIAAIDLIARLLLIERKVSLKYGFDPRILAPKRNDTETEDPATPTTEAQTSSPKPEDATSAEVNTHASAIAAAQKRMADIQELTLPQVLVILAKSSRTLVVTFSTFSYGVAFAGQEPALALHVAEIWDLNTSQIGLVFLASVVPTIFSTPLSGWLSDMFGVEWPIFGSIVLAIPWWLIIIIEKELALFICSFACESFFSAAVIAPLTTELANVAQQKGIGYAHVYASFNLAFGIGSSVGPIIGGQIYDHLDNGWAVISYIAVGLLVIMMVLTAMFSGERPLLKRLSRRGTSTGNDAQIADN